MNKIQLIFGHGTPKKAFLTALVVGTILILINHGDQIVAGNFPHIAKIAMTYIVPYIGFTSFIACPILAYRLLVISELI